MFWFWVADHMKRGIISVSEMIKHHKGLERQMVRKQFQLTAKYISVSAKNQGFELEYALTEFIDNSYGNGANKVEVSMTPQKKDGFTFTIKDNGNGMPQLKLEKAITHIGYDDQYNDKSVSVYGAGMKYGMWGICDEGTVNVTTVSDGYESRASFSTHPRNAGHVDLYPAQKVNKPNGTTITITNVQVKELDLEKIFKNMSVRYFPGLELIPGIELHLPNYKDYGATTAKVEFQDPLYRHLSDDDATYINEVPDEFILGKDTINVTRYTFNQDKMVSNNKEFINWDSKLEKAPHSKAGFIMNRSGIFIKIGFRYATIGGGDFVFMSPQMNYNNLRIEIDIPKHLATKFLQINKSKSQLQKTGMDKLQEIIKLMAREHQSERCPGAPLNNEEEQQLEELNNLLNDAVKKAHHANLLNLNDVCDVIPEEPAKPRKDHQGGTKYQPNFQKADDWFQLRFEDAGLTLPHYRATRQNKKLIISLNNNHPYVYNYLRKMTDLQAQKNEGIKLYSNYIGLSKARVLEQFNDLAMNKIIESEADELRKFFTEEN
jgi:hypothetical protein